MQQQAEPNKSSVMSREAYQVWHKCVMAFLRSVAKRQFGRIAEFQTESSEPQFARVLTEYERVLWKFVMDQTPDSLLERINRVRIAHPDLSEAQNCQVTQYYLLRRAVFLTGLNYEKAHEPEWYRDFADEFAVAARLDDRAVFEALVTVKKKQRMKKVKPNWGQIRFCILLAWLAGGLWKLPSDGERAARLNEMRGTAKTGDGDEIVSEARFCKARQRLGLKL